MNILILTGRFGMGHYSAAEAIKQEILLTNADETVNVIDIMDYIAPALGDFIYKDFNFLVSKCSRLYNFLNEITAKYSSVPFKNLFEKKIDCLLSLYHPDLIVSTLPVCSQYISSYKDIKECTIPLYTYITDITAHTEWIAKNTDLYFVGDNTTKNSLISKGVSSQKIVVSGIPVKQTFKIDCCTPESKTNKEILVMGGGLGLIPCINELINTLSGLSLVHITVITGENKKLYRSLQAKFPQVTVVGFTDHVYEYMRTADLIITKSGGITTFEAIQSETPLYIITPFLAQEVGNAEFIENKNIGRVLWSDKRYLPCDVLSLLRNDALLRVMKDNMRQLKIEINTVSLISEYRFRSEVLCG